MADRFAISDDSGTNKNVQSSSITCVYQSHIGGFWRNVTVIWCKNLINHSLTVSVDSLDTDDHPTWKIDLKTWQFWAKRGHKTFDVDGNRLEAFWDFRSAKFSGGPEPKSDYYVALVSDQEMVLLLGDGKSKAYKRTKSRTPLVDPGLFYKKDQAFGKKCFSSRARFDRRRKDSEVVVESSTLWGGPRDPEMWISVDGIVVVHVENLQWKFRGNKTVMVNKVPVQVFWDVHDWLFCSAPGPTHGLFIFKPVAAEAESENEEGGGDDNDSDCSGGSRYYSTKSHSSASHFCLFLYAWKLE